MSYKKWYGLCQQEMVYVYFMDKISAYQIDRQLVSSSPMPLLEINSSKGRLLLSFFVLLSYFKIQILLNTRVINLEVIDLLRKR